MDVKLFLCCAAVLQCYMLPISEGNPYTALKRKMKNLETRMRTKVDTLETELKDDLMYSVLPTMLPELIRNTLNDLLLTNDMNGVIQYKEELRGMKTRMYEMKGRVKETIQQLQEVQSRNVLLEDAIRQHEFDLDLKLFNLSATDQDISEQFTDLNHRVDTMCNTCCTSEKIAPEMTSSVSLTPSPASSTTPSTLPTTTSKPKTSPRFTNTTGIVTSLFGSPTFKFTDINSKETTELPIRANWIITVTYDPISGKLIWGQALPIGIYSSYPYRRRSTLLKANVWTYCMAVDPGRRLVAVGDHDESTIHWMTVDGTQYKGVASLEIGDGPWSIALDTVNEVMYVCHNDKILKMSYNGKNREIIVKGRIFTAAINDMRDILYYGVGRNVKTISLKGSRKRSHLANVRDSPHILMYYNDDVIINYWKQSGLDYVNTLNGSVDVNVIETGKSQHGRYARHSLCLIT